MIIKFKGIEYGDMKFEDLLPYVGKHCKVTMIDGSVFEFCVAIERRYDKFGTDDYIDTGMHGRYNLEFIKSIEECKE